MSLPSIAAYDLPVPHELPPSKAPWQADRGRMALLVHDMQRYFCAAFAQGTGPLAEVVANISCLLQSARQLDVPVFYTAQKGGQLREDRGLQADLWGPGMKAVPEHEDILAELAPMPGDIVLVKHRYSAFQRSNLEHLMRARGRDQLAIAGIYAHIGCFATAVEAFQRDIQPFVLADAQADFDRSGHDMAMSMAARYSGVVTGTGSFIKALEATS
ncbi:isochorismatase family protein [Paracoccus methylarcula]|uniref:2,3-dihydro-2,3-dihydroxybenzoate synthetase n=1 Tax=Paracoccus methylarcula TaxID=72022 RepID=A0A3R7LR70_9RHOB|nr:isochorismatase family protein [Paracoccus methylarcula]RNF35944.1 2,3-dihydro-2,3-dihydroxybenzoate synthetase [Paracoccus methylarcula]